MSDESDSVCNFLSKIAARILEPTICRMEKFFEAVLDTIQGLTRKEWLSEAETAELCGVAKGTVSNWRTRGEGPSFYNPHGIIRYKRTDVEAWMRSFHVHTKEQPK